MSARSNKPEVRNPVLALPSLRALRDQPPEIRALLAALLMDIQREARARADKSWRTRKAFMAAYWAVVAVYAGHIARAIAATPGECRTKPRFVLRQEGYPDRVVRDWADASDYYAGRRDQAGLGASGFPEGIILLADLPIGRISYNGRIWPLGNWQAGDEPIYDNRLRSDGHQ